MKKKKIQGFTLIELLVVVSIIGLLITVSMFTLNISRIKSRDARRMADLVLIQKALDLYYHDNVSYPAVNAAQSDAASWDTLQAALLPYMKNLPKDPLNNSNYLYYYDADSGNSFQSYGIMARIEFSGNFPLGLNDGGFNSSYGQYIEKGSQPAYCMAKTPVENWWGNQTTVCANNN